MFHDILEEGLLVQDVDLVLHGHGARRSEPFLAVLSVTDTVGTPGTPPGGSEGTCPAAASAAASRTRKKKEKGEKQVVKGAAAPVRAVVQTPSSAWAQDVV
eukprot:1633864-Pyramimonas_sp.AAC.1